MATVTSGIKLRMKSESTYGTVPTGAFNEIRMTSEDLSPNMEYTESQAIRADGQITEMVRTDAMGGGTINSEVAYDNPVFGEFMRAGLCSSETSGGTWATVAAVTGTGIAAVAATGTVPGNFTDTANGFGNIKAGMWVKVSGFTGTAANNTIFKVIKAAAGVVHVIGNTLVSDADGESVTIQVMAEVQNGKTVPSYALEREDSDDTNEFHQYLGMTVTGMDVSIPTSGIASWSFNFEGKKPTSETATIGDGGSDTAQPTTSPMAAADVHAFYEGDPGHGVVSDSSAGTGHEWAEQPFQLLDFSLSVSPNLRQRRTVGSIGPSALPGRGDISVTGSFRCYYNADADGATRTNSTLADKCLNDTVSGLALAINDAAGNGYIFDLPRVQFTNVTRNTPGKSQDVIAEVEFQAYRNPDDNNVNTGVDGTTIRIARGVF